MRRREFITLIGDGVGSLQQPPNHHLAQLNIGRIRYEIDDPRMADFTNNLARVNGLAERTPGFVWRYIDESGNSTSTRPYADPKIAINLSVWENVEALERFVLPDRSQAILQPPRGMVRAFRRPESSVVVGAGRPSAERRGGGRAHRSSEAAWSKRSRV